MAKKTIKPTKEETLETILFNCRNSLRGRAAMTDKRDLLLTLVFLKFIGERFKDQQDKIRKDFIENGIDDEGFIELRRSQIKAAVKVNEEMLQFYWELGRDIVEMHVEERWGEGVMKALSTDLQKLNPTAHCFSRTNLYYVKKFYLTYSSYTIKIPQLGGQIEKIPQLGGQITQHIEGNAGDANTPQVVEQIKRDIMSIGWGHHKLLMDKCSDSPQKAIFFVHQTVLNGWSRSMLLNFLDTDLYERQGKALTNFSTTLPEETSDLAQELTKDPYDFAFTGITGRYNERLLKDKLLSNITQFMVELGTGFAYVGKEYRLQVGEREQFIDLLFYNLNLS